MRAVTRPRGSVGRLRGAAGRPANPSTGARAAALRPAPAPRSTWRREGLPGTSLCAAARSGWAGWLLWSGSIGPHSSLGPGAVGPRTGQRGQTHRVWPIAGAAAVTYVAAGPKMAGNSSNSNAFTHQVATEINKCKHIL